MPKNKFYTDPLMSVPPPVTVRGPEINSIEINKTELETELKRLKKEGKKVLTITNLVDKTIITY